MIERPPGLREIAGSIPGGAILQKSLFLHDIRSLLQWNHTTMGLRCKMPLKSLCFDEFWISRSKYVNTRTFPATKIVTIFGDRESIQLSLNIRQCYCGSEFLARICHKTAILAVKLRVKCGVNPWRNSRWAKVPNWGRPYQLISHKKFVNFQLKFPQNLEVPRSQT